MYVIQYFAPYPCMEPGPSMEDIEHRVRQKYIAEVQSRPATLKKIHLYKSAKKLVGIVNFGFVPVLRNSLQAALCFVSVFLSSKLYSLCVLTLAKPRPLSWPLYSTDQQLWRQKYSWSWFHHCFIFKEGSWCHIKFGVNCKKYSRSWFFRSKTCSMAYMTKYVGYDSDWKKQRIYTRFACTKKVLYLQILSCCTIP